MKDRVFAAADAVRQFFMNLFSSRLRVILLCVILAVLLLAAVLAAVLLPGRAAASQQEAALQPGIDYILSLESADTAPVEDAIKEQIREDRREALEGDDVDIWQMFSDVVIIGDSRAMGFYEYEHLDSQHVLGGIGYILRQTLDFSDELQVINPSHIVLIYGINDIEYGGTAEDFIEVLDEVITQLQELLPDVTVYVNSIMPAVEPALSKQSTLQNIPEWNEAIRAYCEENDVPYIDVTDTIAEHSDLYEPDGIHVANAFYEYWAEDIIMAIIDNE